MAKAIDCDFSVEGNGPPLFLIHGIGASRSAWRFLIPSLRDHFTIITYDLCGHGKSPHRVGEMNLDHLVADLEKVREVTKFEKAHFAGHSLGGMIAPAYARKFPNRVISLGLLSTAAGRSPEDSSKVWGVIHEMEKVGVQKTLNNLVDRWFTDKFIRDYPDIVEQRIQEVIAMDVEVFLNVFRIYAKTEMASWLHEISIPSLVLTGEKDGGCNPRLNQFIANTLPNSKLVVLSKYKHSLLLEAPTEVARHLIEFMIPK